MESCIVNKQRMVYSNTYILYTVKSKCLWLQVSPSPLVHLQRWHNTVIHQPRFEAVYHPEAFKEDLISHKDQSSKKTADATTG